MAIPARQAAGREVLAAGAVARLDYDREKEVLWVDHPGVTLVSLGTTDARAYRLHVGFRQSRWVGGIGVYFGGRPADAPYIFRFQGIKLHTPQPNDPRAFHLERWFGSIQEKPDNEPQGPTQGFASCRLARAPDNSEQLLELIVKPDGLATVRWNGELCPDLATPAATEKAKKRGVGCQGEFGISCQASSVTVTTARFLPLE